MHIGGWGCESNREIIGFLRCEWVRETMCFLSLGRAAPTCAAPAPASLVFPCVFSVNPFPHPQSSLSAAGWSYRYKISASEGL